MRFISRDVFLLDKGINYIELKTVQFKKYIIAKITY